MHAVLAIPPAFAFALLLVLIGTQLAYLVAPARAGYLLRLGVSALAVAVGELAGAAGIGAHLAVGELHPAQDLVLLALAQWSLTRWRRGAASA